MLKVILIIVFVIGTVTMVPQVRNRVFPVLEPVISKLGPVGDKLMLPVQKYEARNDATALIGMMTQQRTQGKQLPNSRNFTAWVKRLSPNDSSAIDPWGGEYYMRTGASTISVGSPGPDGTKETEDDVIITKPWD